MSEPTRNPPSFYIDEHVNLYEGEEAERRLRAHSDAAAVDPRAGIARVGEARWQEAQRYERRTWMEKARRQLSDRNEHHRERFAGYSHLRGRSFGRAIELGCGPFTNMRLIAEQCRVERIHLLDPLILDYLDHPACRYRGGRLGGLARVDPRQARAAARHPLQFARSLLNAYRIGGLLGRPVAIEPATIEAFQTAHRFDLVVMINVIEHCRDVYAIFDTILRIAAPGATFVFHDVLYDAAQVQRELAVSYDAGHPLRVDQAVVGAFLERHFEPLMHARHWVSQEFRGAAIPRNELYYIGRRRGPG